jgi:hypothetical protein
MAGLGVAWLATVGWVGRVTAYNAHTTQRDATQRIEPLGTAGGSLRSGKAAMSKWIGQRIRPEPETFIMDGTPARVLPVNHELIRETIDVFLGAGMIEDTGERRMNRRGELEPVYRVVRKRGR